MFVSDTAWRERGKVVCLFLTLHGVKEKSSVFFFLTLHCVKEEK